MFLLMYASWLLVDVGRVDCHDLLIISNSEQFTEVIEFIIIVIHRLCTFFGLTSATNGVGQFVVVIVGIKVAVKRFFCDTL